MLIKHNTFSYVNTKCVLWWVSYDDGTKKPADSGLIGILL
ncbi:hypothetical protein L342_4727 [Escherichia coli CE516]|nr:hypothetical protein L342_4727 [Escherichia coli CE516]